MDKQGFSLEVICATVECSAKQTAEKAIGNQRSVPDNVDSDIEHLPEDIKTAYTTFLEKHPDGFPYACGAGRGSRRTGIEGKRRKRKVTKPDAASPVSQRTAKKPRFAEPRSHGSEMRDGLAPRTEVPQTRRTVITIIDDDDNESVKVEESADPLEPVKLFLRSNRLDESRFLPFLQEGGITDQPKLQMLLDLQPNLQGDMLENLDKHKKLLMIERYALLGALQKDAE
ncbi:hypothetical protein JAAARDRAFT_565715 [Jaapia argillacea MUCL 33604]|uniref:Uncharacterized protein n=1 Tax=Jaapia argillacea MUCL 33604 TaxID=933084 RepID=A0A067Q1N0_9AGAM|nr:hypothetical protein JAAARDRAFT_565715 [Jaapia argillacea MUCL 33604]